MTKQQVREEVNIRMHYEITGCTRKRKKQLLRQYENIIVVLWEEFGVSLNQVHWCHIIMYFTYCEKILDLSSGTRYRHWLRLREILSVIGVYNEWEHYLQGDWRNPLGLIYTDERSNAGRKPKYC